MNFDRKSHWENIYTNKGPKEVSWYQENPEISLKLIHETGMPLTAPLIDIGGGDSMLVDQLLDKGYTDVTVLDVSAAAIEKAKNRLGERAEKVKWIVTDVAAFRPSRNYSVWHDRAAFHFLTNPQEVAHYCNMVNEHIHSGGNLIIGTFSDKGPLKCSGIPIQQYTAESLSELIGNSFEMLDSFTIDHTTPFETTQNFLFCRFLRR